jgi:hypothetical protein
MAPDQRLPDETDGNETLALLQDTPPLSRRIYQQLRMRIPNNSDKTCMPDPKLGIR